MADTLQTVRWSLTGDAARGGFLAPPVARERPNDVRWHSIRRTTLEEKLRSEFHFTEPVWYGLWLNSPLTREQCVLLRTLLTDVAVLARRYRDRVQPFLEALRDAAETGAAMNVSLAPPGHVDMGWITTFVHCPRCKAEGPFPRWQKNYPVDLILCPVCGHSYSPAATHIMEREYFAKMILCDACGASHRIKDFRPDEIEVLESQHALRDFGDELSWLRRVAAFYQRYPQMRRRPKRDFKRAIDPCNPAVKQDLRSCSNDQDESPAYEKVGQLPANCSGEDREVLGYLRHNLFLLEPRWEFVTRSLDRLKAILENRLVLCPACGTTLHAP